MTDVVRLPGDYLVVTKTNGTITLDTTGQSGAAGTGTVVIKGNLDVQGIQTVVESTTTIMKDSILVLNSGQQPTGSEAAQVNNIDNTGPDQFRSGFVIDRGFGTGLNGTRASFLWDDAKQGFFVEVNNAPAYSYSGGLRLDTTNLPEAYYINGRPRFTLSGVETPNAILSINHESTTSDYASYLEADGVDNDIPNKAYVDGKFQNTSVSIATTATSLRNFNSFVTITDSALGGGGVISFFIDDYLQMQIEQDSVQMAGLGVVGTSLSTVFTNTNLYLNAVGADVVVQSAVAFQTPTYTPVATNNEVKVYSTSTTGPGGTGLLFVNSQGQDELMSAKKALIYSIIF